MLLEIPLLDEAFDLSLQVVAIGGVVAVVLMEVVKLRLATLLRISMHRDRLNK